MDIFNAFSDFSNLLGDNTDHYVVFFMSLLLSTLLLFILFLLSLSGKRRKSTSLQTAGSAGAAFDVRYLDRLKAVSKDTQNVMEELNETITAKEQEITHKYERIQQLEEKSERLEFEIEERAKSNRIPFNPASMMIGILIGVLLIGGLVGLAYWREWITFAL